jgi:hypothetical protein
LVAAGVGQNREAQPARALATDLDDDADQGLALALAPATAAVVVATDEGLVNLDLPVQRLALGGDHRPAQLLQDQPGGLIA